MKTENAKVADRIADNIIETIQRELNGGADPVALLGGQLLALKSLTETAKALNRPASLLVLDSAVDQVLFELANIQ